MTPDPIKVPLKFEHFQAKKSNLEFKTCMAAQKHTRAKRPHAAVTLADFIAPKALPRPTGLPLPPDAFAHQRDMLREAITGAQAGFEFDIDSCDAPDLEVSNFYFEKRSADTEI